MRIPTLEAAFDESAHLFYVVRYFGNQCHVRTRGQSGVQGDPARMPAHHLHQHDALVRFGRAVQPIDGVGGDGQRGIEPESDIGAIDVVVDRLGHPDHGDILVGEPARRGERALPTDRDQHIDPVVVEGLLDLVQPGAQLVGIGPRGAQHRATLGQQPVVAVVVGQLDAPVLQQTAPAVLKSHDLRVVAVGTGPYHRPDDGV